MKNIIVNGIIYNDISNVVFNTDTGEQASYLEESEVAGGGSSNPYETKLDLGSDGSYLFAGYAGESLDEYFTDSVKSRIKTLRGTFYKNSGVYNIDLEGVSGTTVLQFTFNGCTNLTNINWGGCLAHNVTTLENCFASCSALTNIDLSNIRSRSGKTSTFTRCFNNCSALKTITFPSDVEALGISNAQGMFSGCYSLTTINGFENVNGKLTNATDMFYNCRSLPYVDLMGIDMGYTIEMNNCARMFYGCEALTEIAGVLDLRNISYCDQMFYGCNNLTTFTLKNIKKTLDIAHTMASDETLFNIAKELVQTLIPETLIISPEAETFYANNYVKLIEVTEEMIAEDDLILYKMPFEVCTAEDEGAMTIAEYIVSKNWDMALL